MNDKLLQPFTDCWHELGLAEGETDCDILVVALGVPDLDMLGVALGLAEGLQDGDDVDVLFGVELGVADATTQSSMKVLAT